MCAWVKESAHEIMQGNTNQIQRQTYNFQITTQDNNINFEISPFLGHAIKFEISRSF